MERNQLRSWQAGCLLVPKRFEWGEGRSTSALVPPHYCGCCRYSWARAKLLPTPTLCSGAVFLSALGLSPSYAFIPCSPHVSSSYVFSLSNNISCIEFLKIYDGGFKWFLEQNYRVRKEWKKEEGGMGVGRKSKTLQSGTWPTVGSQRQCHWGCGLCIIGAVNEAILVPLARHWMPSNVEQGGYSLPFLSQFHPDYNKEKVWLWCWLAFNTLPPPAESPFRTMKDLVSSSQPQQTTALS